MMKKLLVLLGIFLFFPILLVLFFFVGITETVGGGNEFQPATEQERVALEIYQLVMEVEGTEEFAFALIANAEAESGLNPKAIQGGLGFNEFWAYNDTLIGYAFGTWQMDGSRRVNMLNLAKEQGVDWQTVAHQFNYIWSHDGGNSEILKNYSDRTDLEETTLDILKYWERAGTKDDPVEQNKRITSAKNWQLRFQSGFGNGAVGGGVIASLEEKLGKPVYNGQCYGLISYYVDGFDTGIHLGAGSPYGLSGNTSFDTVNAWNIGSAYAWEDNGFLVVFNPKFSDIRAGDILNLGQGGVATSSFGHSLIVASVEADEKFFAYEQNAERGQIVSKYQRTWGKDYPRVVSLVRKM